MRKNTAELIKLGILIPAMVLSLAACGGSGQQSQNQAEPETEETTQEPAAESTQEEAEAPAETEEETAETADTAAEAAQQPAAAQGEGARVYENGSLRMSVPVDYAELLQIDKQQSGIDNILFCVKEKESVEMDKAQGGNNDTAGWLFSIGTVDESTAHEMICNDMSGAEIFAKGEDDTYYVFYHPTDVTIVRENYEDEEAMENWTRLNEWASSMKDTIVSENGLTAQYFDNSLPAMFLFRTAYDGSTKYTISTTEFGPMEPGDVDPLPYVEKLTAGARYEYVDEEAPDGEYVVLAFPDEEERLDFFFAEGKENYVRRIYSAGDGEEYSEMFKVTFEDGTTKATEVMNEWYHALVNAQE